MVVGKSSILLQLSASTMNLASVSMDISDFALADVYSMLINTVTLAFHTQCQKTHMGESQNNSKLQ